MTLAGAVRARGGELRARMDLLAAVARAARAVAAAHVAGVAGRPLGAEQVSEAGELEAAWSQPVKPSLLTEPDTRPDPDPDSDPDPDPDPDSDPDPDPETDSDPETDHDHDHDHDHEHALDHEHVRRLLWLVLAGEEKGERPLLELAPAAPAGLVALVDDAKVSLEELADRIDQLAPAPAPKPQRSRLSLRLPGAKILIAIAGGLLVAAVALGLLWRGERGHRRDAERAAATARADANHGTFFLAEALVDAADEAAAEHLDWSAALHGAAALAHLTQDRPGAAGLRAAARGHALWAALGPVRGLERDRDLEAPVAAVAAGGDLVLTAAGSTVKLWRADGSPAGSLVGHKASVVSVALSRDGERAVSSADGELFVWHVDSRRLMRQLPRADAAAAADLALSPDGARLVTAERDGTVKIWRLDDPAGDAPLSRVGHRGEVLAVGFSAAGDVFASAGADGRVDLWDAATGTKRGFLGSVSGRPLDLAFSPSGEHIAVASANTVEVGYLPAGVDALGGEPLVGHHGTVRSVAFTPDGELVVAAGDDGSVRAWDRRDLAPLFALDAHDDGATGVAALTAKDGVRLLSGGGDGHLRVWRLGAGDTRSIMLGSLVRAFALSDDGKQAFLGGSSELLRWDPKAGTTQPLLPVCPQAYAVASAPGGRFVAASCLDNSVRVWDADRKQELPLILDHGGARVLAFSPDGALLATGGRDGTVRLWVSESTLQASVLRAKEGAVTAVAFSPDGARLAAAGETGWLEVWTRREKTAVPEKLLAGDGPWRALAFAPDGDALLGAEREGTVAIQLGSWARKGVGDQHDEVHTIRFTADGARALLGGRDHLRVVAFPSGDPLLTLPARTTLLDVAGASLLWTDGIRVRTAPLPALRADATVDQLRAAAESATGLTLDGFRPVRRR